MQRLKFKFPLLILLCVALFTSIFLAFRKKPRIELVGIRYQPFITARNQSAKMVLVDLKNTGNAPARQVKGKVTFYDGSGKAIRTDPTKTIYKTSPEAYGIRPGETYICDEWMGEIVLILPPYGPSDRVEIEILGASEQGIDDGIRINFPKNWPSGN